MARGRRSRMSVNKLQELRAWMNACLEILQEAELDECTKTSQNSTYSAENAASQP